VGPNGAGKTTLINTIAGLQKVKAGVLRFNGREISRLASHRFCGAGIAIVPRAGGSSPR
jgi:branched-chain amino acid transport system ATP-binding protein